MFNRRWGEKTFSDFLAACLYGHPRNLTGADCSTYICIAPCLVGDRSPSLFFFFFLRQELLRGTKNLFRQQTTHVIQTNYMPNLLRTTMCWCCCFVMVSKATDCEVLLATSKARIACMYSVCTLWLICVLCICVDSQGHWGCAKLRLQGYIRTHIFNLSMLFLLIDGALQSFSRATIKVQSTCTNG